VQGQCFNWYRLEEARLDTWVGVVDGIPLAFRQTELTASYAPLLPLPTLSATELDTFVRSYLQLETDLEVLYTQWAAGCPRMCVVTQALPGVRVLRQPPWECLISFICSSNNNIKRITSMLDRLKRAYGRYCCTVELVEGQYRVVISPEPPVLHAASFSAAAAAAEGSDDEQEVAQATGTPSSSRKRAAAEQAASPSKSPAAAVGENNNKGSSTVVHLFSFPSPLQLAAAQEGHLRALGMGYRAKFLQGSAEKIQELGGPSWLLGLRSPEASSRAAAAELLPAVVAPETSSSPSPSKKGPKAKKDKLAPEPLAHRLYVNQQLQQLPGVGPKVGDCVAVFSLDQADTVPVDVHVFDIAARDYDPTLLQPSQASATGQLASLTPRLYERVGALFRDRFGSHAGWAHSVLFAAELPPFKHALPAAMQEEMSAFDLQQRAAKKARTTASRQHKQHKGMGKSPAQGEAYSSIY
jgi:N-glycosylase/DNA lyase